MSKQLLVSSLVGTAYISFKNTLSIIPAREVYFVGDTKIHNSYYL